MRSSGSATQTWVVLAMVGALALASVQPALGATKPAAYKAYEKGIKALDSGHSALARDELRKAISIDSKQGRFRSGSRFSCYLPSVYLAQAYLELEEFEEAEAQLDTFDAEPEPKCGTEFSLAAELRSQLRAALRTKEVPPVSGGTTTGGSAGAKTAADASRAYGRGDFSLARRLALQALQQDSGNETASSVLRQVDTEIVDRVSRAKSEKEAGELEDAEARLKEALDIDAGNEAADSLLKEVRRSQREARSALDDANAALAAKRWADAEKSANRARSLDASLASESRALKSRIAKARSSSGTRGGGKPSGGPSAASLLASARKALDKGDLEEARRLAEQARQADGSVGATVTALQDELVKRADAAGNKIRDARAAAGVGRFDAARSAVDEAIRLDGSRSSEAEGLRASIRRDDERAKVMVAKVSGFLEVGATAQAEKSIRELSVAFPEYDALSDLRAQAAGTGDVVAGVKAFFRGDVGEAIRTLGQAAEKHPERGDVLAVLGAAHATRALLGEEGQGTEDLKRAADLFVEANAKSPGISLDPRYFSPRVREIFDQALAG